MQGTKLSMADLSGADLRAVHLARAEMNGTNFANAEFTGASLEDADLSQALNLTQAQIDSTNPAWRKNARLPAGLHP